MKDHGFIGLISDTHGLLRKQAIDALQGSQLIIHAGDVGDPDILRTLGQIAPVIAVRGNVDKGDWAEQLPPTAVTEIGSSRFYILHDLNELDLDPTVSGFSFVISGHSHKPSHTERRGVIYINPGSAGPRRFKLPITIARLDLRTPAALVEFVSLEQV
jgi:uncharacterized protein